MTNSITKTTTELKDDFMHLFTGNDKIVQLIDNQDIEIPDDLINQNIFPRMKIDFKTKDATQPTTPYDSGTYIGIKIDYPSISTNDAYKKYMLTVMIISHNSHMKLITGGNRNDALGEEIISTLNFNCDVGFTLKLTKDVEDPFNADYYYRRLTFESVTTNSLDNHWGIRNG